MSTSSEIPYGEEVPAAPAPRSRKRLVLSWAAAALVVILCGAWMLSDLSWSIDLLGSFAPHLAWLGVMVAALLLVMKARLPAGLALVGALLGFLSTGVVRADRIDAPGRERVIRVLQFNAATENGRAQEAFDLIMSSDADVVALTEPPMGLLELIRARAGSTYKWTDFPANAGPGWRLTLSRWPIEKIEGVSDPTFSKLGFWVVKIKRPAGEFVFIQAHPDSPRTYARWAGGRDALEELAKVVDVSVRPLQVPVIMAADLNSPPSGLRGRLMNERFGFERAKPRLKFAGTFPSWLPNPLRLAIDDVFIQSAVGVSSWETLGPAGSDHMAVRVDVVVRDLPPASPSAGSEGR